MDRNFARDRVGAMAWKRCMLLHESGSQIMSSSRNKRISPAASPHLDSERRLGLGSPARSREGTGTIEAGEGVGGSVGRAVDDDDDLDRAHRTTGGRARARLRKPCPGADR